MTTKVRSTSVTVPLRRLSLLTPQNVHRQDVLIAEHSQSDTIHAVLPSSLSYSFNYRSWSFLLRRHLCPHSIEFRPKTSSTSYSTLTTRYCRCVIARNTGSFFNRVSAPFEIASAFLLYWQFPCSNTVQAIRGKANKAHQLSFRRLFQPSADHSYLCIDRL